jgi:hypothetical protein
MIFACPSAVSMMLLGLNRGERRRARGRESSPHR